MLKKFLFLTFMCKVSLSLLAVDLKSFDKHQNSIKKWGFITSKQYKYNWEKKIQEINLDIENLLTSKPTLIPYLIHILSEETQARAIRKFITDDKIDIVMTLIKEGFSQSFHGIDKYYSGVADWAIKNNRQDVLLTLINLFKTKDKMYEVKNILNFANTHGNPILWALNLNNVEAISILVNNLPEEILANWLDKYGILMRAKKEEKKDITKILFCDEMIEKLKKGIESKKNNEDIQSLLFFREEEILESIAYIEKKKDKI